jgi:hypothetical protein
LAPSGTGLLKVKVFWRQKVRVILRLKISGVITATFGTTNANASDTASTSKHAQGRTKPHTKEQWQPQQ